MTEPKLIATGQVWYVLLPETKAEGMIELMTATVIDVTRETIQLEWERPPGYGEEPTIIKARFRIADIQFVEQHL